MPKIAELHNGTQIHFPDDIADADMDAQVKKHLGVSEQKTEAAGVGEVTPLLLNMFTSHLHNQTKAEKERDGARMTEEEKKTKELRDAVGAIIYAILTNGRPLANLAQISSTLKAVATQQVETTKALEEIISSIKQLEKTVAANGKALVDVSKMERKIVRDDAHRVQSLVLKG